MTRADAMRITRALEPQCRESALTIDWMIARSYIWKVRSVLKCCVFLLPLQEGMIRVALSGFLLRSIHGRYPEAQDLSY